MTRFPDVYEIQNPDGDFPAVFTVEHARHTIPDFLNELGVSEEDKLTHIGWDIGIEGVTRRLSDLLNVPTIYCLYSRLIIDVNRPIDHPQLCRPESDEIIIPGNVDLSAAETKERIDDIFHVYDKAAATLIADVRTRNPKPFLFSMHSCTVQLRGQPLRPWEIGFSTYGCDEEMNALAAILHEEGFNVGLHAPYDTREMPGASCDRHGRGNGLPHLLVEIRQDLIADEEGQQRWADILARAYTKFLCA